MLYVVNALHVEYQTIIKVLQGNRKPFVTVSSIKEACRLIESEEEVDTDEVVFVGFIYKDNEVSEYVKDIDNKYFITNVGYLPEDFITSKEEDRGLSLLSQLIKLELLDKKGCEFKDVVGQHLYYVDEEVDNFVRFKPTNPSFNPLKAFNISYVDYHMIETFAERAFVRGNTFFIYENNPVNKLFLAHNLLDKVDKGLVVIGSQTRSTNDMLSFYGKNIDMQYLADKFGVEIEQGENVFNVFIHSHMNILGKQITDFISEGI